MRSGSLTILALILCAAGADVGAQGTSANLVNSSAFDIHELYLSPSQPTRWGPDQLAKKILESGESVALTGVACGDYDVKLVNEDGDECVVEEQTVCGDEGDWVLTDEELLGCEGFETTASATLVNRSEYAIYQLFLSPAEDSHWGPDRLGEKVLRKGKSFTLTDIACGDYDVKLVDEDGDECVVREIYLCGEKEAELTTTDLVDCQMH